MNGEKFHAILNLLVPEIVELISSNHTISEMEAAASFYRSSVYALLEAKDTALWHYSPLTLYYMYDE